MYQRELNSIKSRNRFRKREIYHNIIDLASNDYLGLSEVDEILDKAYFDLKKYKYHSSKSSLLVNGYTDIHKKFEDKLKILNNFEDAVIVGNGFLANLAVFELGRKGDIFLVDSEYHASGIVGSKLTQAEVRFFKHNDLNDLKKISIDYKKFNRVFIVVEGIYSMRGDLVNSDLLEYGLEIGYLIIDEAHSVGVVGNNLMGVTNLYNLNRKKIIKIGTLGKALSSYGAYILANKEIIDFLLNKAKSIIYTTSLSLIDVLLAYYSVEYIIDNLNKLKSEIEKRKKLFNTESLIKIIEVPNNGILLKKHRELLDEGILIGAIRPPTVSKPLFRIILRLPVSEDIILKVIEELNC